MGTLKQAALVLGEGPSEFFYFKSLCDVFKHLTIKPDYPKHTTIKELETKISDGVAMGYNRIFCIVDMDTKAVDPERSQYQKLKAKYAEPVSKPRKGIYCKVEFFETHRCTELFFLYYFRYTSRQYKNQSSLLKDLNRCVKYQKTIDFSLKVKVFMVILKGMEEISMRLSPMPTALLTKSKRVTENIHTRNWGV